MIDIVEKKDLQPLHERLERLENLLRLALNQPAEFMSKQGCASYLGIKPATVSYYVKNYGLPVDRSCGYPRFNKSEVDEWRAKNRNGKQKPVENFDDAA